MIRQIRALAVAVLAVGALLAVAPADAQDLKDMFQKFAKPVKPPPVPRSVIPTAPASGSVQAQVGAAANANRYWMGYSLNFQAMRPLLMSADFANARSAYETGQVNGAALPLPAVGDGGRQTTLTQLTSLNPIPKQGGGAASAAATGNMSALADKGAPFLTNVELGTLMLDGGDPAGARAAFDAAGQTVGNTASAREKPKKLTDRIGGAFSSGGRMLASAAGNGELGAYNAPDFERVLQLNYLSLSYLLQGDNKAFNVSRRTSQAQSGAFEDLNDKAARMQDEARIAFEAQKAEADKKLAEINAHPDDGQAGVEGSLQAAYQTPDFCKLANLPSAYVNPLSFYLNGVIYEISSAQFPEDRDTARISYQKAFQLAPAARTLEDAVRDLNANSPKAGRLVHVVVAEGFAPTRQAIQTGLNYNGAVVPITLPRLTCQPSEIASIEVRTVAGKKLARLDAIANLEGMMLRRQKDREPLTAVSIVAQVLRGAAENKVANGSLLGTAAVRMKQESFDRPDMRSWSSLPAYVYVGRVYAPMDAAEVEIISLDASDKVVGRVKMPLDVQSKQNVLYARSVGAAIAPAPAAPLWIRGL